MKWRGTRTGVNPGCCAPRFYMLVFKGIFVQVPSVAM